MMGKPGSSCSVKYLLFQCNKLELQLEKLEEEL
jgi:hypothetical protein